MPNAQPMDTEEMYQRGYADAQRGEPNPFYYQHYFHYRRGYDHGRRGLGQPPLWRRRWSWRSVLIAAIVLLAAALAGLVWLQPRSEPAVTSQAAPAPTALATAAVLPSPTRQPIFPTATPTSQPLISLRVGGKAQIANTEGSGLRARETAGVNAKTVATFKPDEQVTIREGPVEADGYTWWRVEGNSGSGWSAQGSPAGVVWLVPID